MSRQARILLICDDRRGHANTVLDHIDAFRRFSRHQVRTFNTKAMIRSLALDLDEFDVVVVHYSVVLSDPNYVSADFMDKLRRFKGCKVQFIQDDYRWVDRAASAARDAGIDVLFTVAPPAAARRLYDERLPGVKLVQTLTGYVPDGLKGRSITPLAERTVDVGYRARDLPFWYGRLSREKAWIGKRFQELAPAYALRCDIALGEHDRLYGARWIEFLSTCRATLGCESGASIADFDGGAERAVRAYLRAHPGAPFEEVHAAVLTPYEGNVVVNVISPRVFEAASLGTALIMFPGEYSGVIRPDEHYIRLEKDLSNMDDVVRRLRDDDFVAAMTRRAYDDLIASGRWSYRSFIADFDRVIDEEAVHKRGAAGAPRWRAARIERSLRVPGLRVRLFRSAHRVWTRIFRRDESLRFSIDYESQIQKAFFSLRIVLTDPEMRALLRLGRDSGAPLDRLLREIMELYLLRSAARGSLKSPQQFVLRPEYDTERRALCFLSMPPRQNGGESRPDSNSMMAALREGAVEVLEWDHRALGGSIRLDRPSMVVGIGYEGLESFTTIARIGRSHPNVLERAIEPALRHGSADRSLDSVG